MAKLSLGVREAEFGPFPDRCCACGREGAGLRIHKTMYHTPNSQRAARFLAAGHGLVSYLAAQTVTEGATTAVVVDLPVCPLCSNANDRHESWQYVAIVIVATSVLFSMYLFFTGRWMPGALALLPLPLVVLLHARSLNAAGVSIDDVKDGTVTLLIPSDAFVEARAQLLATLRPCPRCRDPLLDGARECTHCGTTIPSP